jgi:hypothetical protein
MAMAEQRSSRGRRCDDRGHGDTAVHKLPTDRPPLQETGALWTAMVRQFGS